MWFQKFKTTPGLADRKAVWRVRMRVSGNPLHSPYTTLPSQTHREKGSAAEADGGTLIDCGVRTNVYAHTSSPQTDLGCGGAVDEQRRRCGGKEEKNGRKNGGFSVGDWEGGREKRGEQAGCERHGGKASMTSMLLPLALHQCTRKVLSHGHTLGATAQ